MENDITPARIANAIEQLASDFDYFVIVEGEKDINLYSKFICDGIKLYQTFGKYKMYDVIDALDERKFDRYVCIKDSDFDRITGVEKDHGKLLSTDCHDSEVMMLNSGALKNLINHFTSESKRRDFLKMKGKDFFDAIIEIAYEIGKVKLATKINDFELVFKPSKVDGNCLKYHKFIDGNNFELKSREQMAKIMIDYSRSRVTCLATSEQILSACKCQDYDSQVMEVVNGHDCTNILFILLKKTLKTTKRAIADYNSVEDALVLAYEYEMFKGTVLYSSLLEYSKAQEVSLLK